MIQFRGYGVEIHEVVTRDGYVLQLHRIVVYHRMHCNVRKKPVLLQHGVFDSSSTWIVSPTNRSLGSSTFLHIFLRSLCEYNVRLQRTGWQIAATMFGWGILEGISIREGTSSLIQGNTNFGIIRNFFNFVIHFPLK